MADGFLQTCLSVELSEDFEGIVPWTQMKHMFNLCPWYDLFKINKVGRYLLTLVISKL